ncbi:MAG: OmpA family protein [bacterium]
MKKTFTMLLASLLLLGGADVMAQNKSKKNGGKKQVSPIVEGRQKVRESDYRTFDKFTNFSSKDKEIYYSSFDYSDLPALTVNPRPIWPEEIRPVMNYLEKVSRATMTLSALFAINPEITDRARREELVTQARDEALASFDAFDTWRASRGMRNKVQYKVAEVDYRHFKGFNYYNSQQSDDIIHVGVLVYLGSKKNNIFIVDTSSRKFQDIKFFPNDATIVESWLPLIDTLADYLKNKDDKGILITGYADDQGTEAYCEGISRQRATEVKKALMMRGINATRIEIEAKGSADPIGDNSTYEGRIMNNRVSLKIQ